MSFEANRTFLVNGAITTQYVVEHPRFSDASTGDAITYAIRNPHVECTNQTTGIVYIAFDRAVVAPSGVGVQGPVVAAQYPITGPIAATPGDFDLAVPNSTGWCALDFVIPQSSKYMSIYTVAAGIVCVSYGNNS